MEIYEQIRLDREAGARRLVAEYKDRLYSAALMLSGSEHDAEELVFRTFAQAVAKISKYKPGGSFYGWLFTILTNFRKMDVRKKMCRVLLFFTEELPERTDPNPDPGETLGAAGEAERVRRAVARLPEQLRATVVLRYFEDLSSPEIAKILKIPEGTVRSRLHTARDLLQAYLRGFAALLLMAWGAALAAPAAPAVCVADVFRRAAEPAGLSDLSHADGDRYWAVDDRGGWLCELEIPIDSTGRVASCSVRRKVALAGRVDLEGCAYDPLDGRVWVADEGDSSIRQFDPETGRETARAPVPQAFRAARPNRSLEALAIAPDGRAMYAANEDTLLCDGAAATTNRGGVVRIQEWTRTGRGAPWIPAREFRFRTRRLRGADWKGLSVSGVVALAADADGSLLVLERELSRKRLPVPTLDARLSRVRLKGVRTGATLAREPLWDASTGFANCEGLAVGPALPDGRRTLLLVSDAGGGLEPCVLTLILP